MNVIKCLAVVGHPHVLNLQKHGFAKTGKRFGLFLGQRAQGLENEVNKLANSSPHEVHVGYGDLP